ncbi:hypothetical protein LX15_000852 [Streptoalloteichus tenebrarius]|uniref:Secreted protein n=1 Tax=Streptoalloteichus tenebrarius (strain ATCC 17920 / DSM 40477 / JCM 4838 / CBS 697.72 / NBRC 16177 / NCIMB 11028 / NRRL B-12390 / A12253. 1 / ISP 5477) TaxID=1933 RepID=A0ABT1HNT2_STRSD|nr:hypothetical protein [Streptoalloteichus tenebrarius]MCP2257167.1 hypothetical protein [Streptoalloteichus tenebrarius]
MLPVRRVRTAPWEVWSVRALRLMWAVPAVPPLSEVWPVPQPFKVPPAGTAWKVLALRGMRCRVLALR